MKKVIKNILALTLASVTLAAIAQDNATPVAIQAGVGHLSKGAATISLNQQMNAGEYFVTITPHAAGNMLYVIKNDNSIIVKEKNGRLGITPDADFDYVVFKNTGPLHKAAMVKSMVPPSGHGAK
jgi:hypothetical protein